MRGILILEKTGNRWEFIQRVWPFETQVERDRCIVDLFKIGLEHNVWAHLDRDEPNQFGNTPEQVMNYLKEKLDAGPQNNFSSQHTYFKVEPIICSPEGFMGATNEEYKQEHIHSWKSERGMYLKAKTLNAGAVRRFLRFGHWGQPLRHGLKPR